MSRPANPRNLELLEGKNDASLRQGSDAQTQKLKNLAERNGVDAGNGEKLYIMTTLVSSKQGVIKQDDPSYKRKLEQWGRANAGEEPL